MEQGKWEFYVKNNEIEDGVYNVAITDDCFDADCFPIHYIVIVSSVVVKQGGIFHSNVYDIPNMVGWDTNQVAEWTQHEPGNAHPQTSHDMMKLSV